MASFDFGKESVVGWIRDNFPKDASILDVGACNGKWRRLLSDYKTMDAVEAWQRNWQGIRPMYRKCFLGDIADYKYDYYDLIIFGDVIEHMDVAKAQKVLAYAEERSSCIIVSVPWLYKQGELDGNPYEVHVQDDLTADLFHERYPGFSVLFDTGMDYCYFFKRQANRR